MTQLTNIAFIRAQKGKSEQLGEHLLALVEPSRAEPGCINYDVHRSNDDFELWCVYENWKSADDLTAHFQLPHMQRFIEAIPSLVEGELDLRAFSMISKPARA
ncbi:antibiotic biosynthesis monooxygenase [Bradyrhizobium sp. BRP19]|uniref:putative quinol monooxygenase n=1 Tax=Bradyrhizobium sp. BRP19 TaxID=2793823 RepID=UPI001CD571E3|nr:putative quinol monooxygenase [Bradyrhizobium sp. BRP19]MCA1551807.1 antibiotic biosynthesis monooxygenase [Bradyrhizobium sp. BRP19]